MTTWQIILIPIGLVFIGFIRQVLLLQKKKHRLNSASEFLNKFIDWCNGQAKDYTLYSWMLGKSETIQTMLAGGGLMSIRRPFENGYHKNVPVILNAIPEIQREWCDSWRDGQIIQSWVQMVTDCLQRFIGTTNEEYRRERIRLCNPLVLFCGGVAWLMELPLLILSETKIITASCRAIIVNGRLFSLVSGIVALAALAGTIITIVTGWDRFVQIVTGWIK